MNGDNSSNIADFIYLTFKSSLLGCIIAIITIREKQWSDYWTQREEKRQGMTRLSLSEKLLFSSTLEATYHYPYLHFLLDGDL